MLDNVRHMAYTPVMANRPPKPTRVTKPERMAFRVDAETKAAVEKAAQESERTTSQWILWVVRAALGKRGQGK